MSKDARLNATPLFIMKSFNKTELQQIALNHLSDIDLKDLPALSSGKIEYLTGEKYYHLIKNK